MILSSLAVLTLSASAAVPSFNNLVHLHSRRASPDTRVVLTLFNSGHTFRDVKIDGKSYTVQPDHTLDLRAPEGTKVYADSLGSHAHRGDVLLEVTPRLQHQKIDLN